MTTLDLDAIKARAGAATAGPWAWRGQDDGSIELRALHSMGKRIITTQRAEPCIVGLPREDEFGGGEWTLTADACDGCKDYAARADSGEDISDYRCSKPENLDTIWLSGEHFIEPANKWAVRERSYRNDVERVDHPDAEFVAHAREDVPALIAEIERLRSLLAPAAPVAEPVEHSCEFCAINYNHPRCPENAEDAAEYICPHCGSDPEDYTSHAEGCPTLGTCASCRPNTPAPWHPEPESGWSLKWFNEHFATEHA